MATFSNQATLSYKGGIMNSNVTTGQLVDVLTATKQAVSSGYGPGENIVYVVTLVNAGDTPLTGLTLTDNLGGTAPEKETVYPLAYVEGSLLYYVGGVPETAPTAEAGPPLTITGVTVPAGSNVTLIYEAAVTQYAPLGADACITNTVTVTGPQSGQASATVCQDQAAQLTITKSVSPQSVSYGDQVTYSFVIKNSGSTPAEAADAVIVTDQFDPILTDLSASLDGAALTLTTDYTYDEVTGEFATVSGVITVPAATYLQNPDGTWAVTPGVTILTVTGTI